MSYTVIQTIALALRSAATKAFVCTVAIAAAATAASLTPAAAATFTCSTVAACVLANNTSRGPAVAGLSRSGDGIVGTTYFNGGTSSSNAKSGIAGFDLSSSRSPNSGVFGYSAAGSGVHASTHNGSGVRAVATGPYGVGVYAVSSDPNGIGELVESQRLGLQVSAYGSGPINPIGIYIGTGSTGHTDVGLYAYTPESGTGIVGYAQQDGVYGYSQGSGGTGVVGDGSGNVGVEALAFDNGTSTTAIPLLVQGGSNDTLIDAQSNPTGAGAMRVLTLDDNGNLDVYGHITAKASAMFETRRADGRRVMAYAPREAEATIEDVGEAQLTAGVAAVPLAADFAQTLDFTRPYYVFVTPEGVNRGVYVTQKTARGFVIRESDGRSTMPVQYRIVGTPRDVMPSRLPSEESLARKLSQPAYRNDAADRRRKGLRARFAKKVAVR